MPRPTKSLRNWQLEATLLAHDHLWAPFWPSRANMLLKRVDCAKSHTRPHCCKRNAEQLIELLEGFLDIAPRAMVRICNRRILRYCQTSRQDACRPLPLERFYAQPVGGEAHEKCARFKSARTHCGNTGGSGGGEDGPCPCLKAQACPHGDVDCGKPSTWWRSRT